MNLMGAIAGVDAPDASIVFYRLAGWKPNITTSLSYDLVSEQLQPQPIPVIYSRRVFYGFWMTALAELPR